MIRAVSNTTLLSNFAHVERPDLPTLAFPDLVMPAAVLDELREGERLGILPVLDWSEISVLEPRQEHLEEVKLLQPPLDRGEIGCLALAKANGAIAVTDDRDARKVARKLGLKISGTLGALINLIRAEQLTLAEADGLLARMIAKIPLRFTVPVSPNFMPIRPRWRPAPRLATQFKVKAKRGCVQALRRVRRTSISQ